MTTLLTLDARHNAIMSFCRIPGRLEMNKLHLYHCLSEAEMPIAPIGRTRSFVLLLFKPVSSHDQEEAVQASNSLETSRITFQLRKTGSHQLVFQVSFPPPSGFFQQLLYLTAMIFVTRLLPSTSSLLAPCSSSSDQNLLYSSGRWCALASGTLCCFPSPWDHHPN